MSECFSSPNQTWQEGLTWRHSLGTPSLRSGKDCLPFVEACRSVFPALLTFPEFEGVDIEFVCVDGFFFWANW